MTGYRHGQAHSPTYCSWGNMVQRCTNEKMSGYARYGGRGITVCERWKNSFEAFFADMGPRPEGMTLDRINNSLGYEPGNCRWATRAEQMKNTRTTHLITFAGKTEPLSVWAKELGLKNASLRKRLKKWPLEIAMNPKRRFGNRFTGGVSK